MNTSIFYEFWTDYFHSLLFHNYFFTSTTYELIGFFYDAEQLCAVVKQSYIKADSLTELENVTHFLNKNIFFIKKNNDYYNSDLGLILEDLHDENVLTSKGALFFIDTVWFYMILVAKCVFCWFIAVYSSHCQRLFVFDKDD